MGVAVRSTVNMSGSVVIGLRACCNSGLIKVAVLLAAMLLATVAARGQGQVIFNNRIGNRFRFAWLTPTAILSGMATPTSAAWGWCSLSCPSASAILAVLSNRIAAGAVGPSEHRCSQSHCIRRNAAHRQ
jgi:hypothetical protein